MTNGFRDGFLYKLAQTNGVSPTASSVYQTPPPMSFSEFKKQFDKTYAGAPKGAASDTHYAMTLSSEWKKYKSNYDAQYPQGAVYGIPRPDLYKKPPQQQYSSNIQKAGPSLFEKGWNYVKSGFRNLGDFIFSI